jgi:glycosyltransferase involved in cell wall biosynthesis
MIIRKHSENPEISVVMAVRNGVTSLAVTMESVLDQDVSALELIVVDDGSEDGSRDVLAAFQKRDKRVKVLLQKPSGLTASLRKGCAIAQGAFIARQDCGDRSLPGRLSKQASILRDSPRVGLVSCFTRYVGPEGEFLYLSDGGGPRGRARGTQEFDRQGSSVSGAKPPRVRPVQARCVPRLRRVPGCICLRARLGFVASAGRQYEI